MKKIVVIFLAVVMCFSVTACGDGKKKAFEDSKEAYNKIAFEVSKEAYNNINTAYDIVEQFGTNLQEAWRIGIQETSEIRDKGVKYLASELSLTEDEIIKGTAYALLTLRGLETTPEKIDAWMDDAAEFWVAHSWLEFKDDYFDLSDEDRFAFCVYMLIGVYEANGGIEKINTALNDAEAKMKELSNEYSDYEHYPNLKDYFATVRSFLEFCQNPIGSYEQATTTINDYRNKARDCRSDLDYIFEE